MEVLEFAISWNKSLSLILDSNIIYVSNKSLVLSAVESSEIIVVVI